ncbi:MAG: AAA family ATPase, partial [Saprospiraceae bacterium]
MILEFSVKNFRSIKDLQTISFATTGLKSAEKHQNVDINNIAIEGDIALFKTIGFYGANASGKSNILKALDYFIKVITKDASSNSHLKSLCDPFLFSEEIEDSFFQIVLLING